MGLPVDSSIVTSLQAGLDTCVSLSRYEILTVLFTPSRSWLVCQIWVEETWEIKRAQERHRDMTKVCTPYTTPLARAELESTLLQKHPYVFLHMPAMSPWKDLKDWKDRDDFLPHIEIHKQTLGQCLQSNSLLLATLQHTGTRDTMTCTWLIFEKPANSQSLHPWLPFPSVTECCGREGLTRSVHAWFFGMTLPWPSEHRADEELLLISVLQMLSREVGYKGFGH